MIRSFIAIELPHEVKELIFQAQSRLKGAGAGVKWVNVRAMHLTLKFLGNVADDLPEKLAHSFSGQFGLTAPLNLQVAGTGFFPNDRRPRVVWVGLRGDLEPLGRAWQQLDQGLATFDFEPETRPFNPHVTLGRVKDNLNLDLLVKRVRALADFSTPSFLVDKMYVFQSDLKPTGAVYTKLSEIKLN
ncbi:MAG: RNA 2',3'-cyclic phosphodiesterase [Deltaproteobacteria bacterium]|nr:RNA 2',3'-cyclic phosphodiesterase [Deltaproteobacteria bacterium]